MYQLLTNAHIQRVDELSTQDPSHKFWKGSLLDIWEKTAKTLTEETKLHVSSQIGVCVSGGGGGVLVMTFARGEPSVYGYINKGRNTCRRLH